MLPPIIPSMPSGVGWAKARGCGSGLLLLALTGCFSTRAVTPRDLRLHHGPVDIQILTSREGWVRGRVDPTEVGSASIAFRPTVHESKGWVVRYGGWPIVYTSGRLWRHEVKGELREIPLDEIRMILVEEYDWGLTVLSSPLTLPVGMVDFLVHHVRFGFEGVDTRFDSFSRPPESGRPPTTPTKIESGSERRDSE